MRLFIKSTVEEGVTVHFHSDAKKLGKALLEEALSFVQEDAPMAEGNAMDAPEETTPEEKPMGLMSRRDM